MTSMCGASSPRPRSASRCSTPNRCCSSTTTRPRSANPTRSWISACVPTTMPASPDCASSSACALGLRAQRAGEQRDLRGLLGRAQLAGLAERAEQRAQRAGVLRGEHLGGREHRGLPAGVDDLQHRPQRDDRLAGADVALHEPVHRVLARRGRRRSRRRPPAGPSVSANGSRASNASSRPPGRGGHAAAGRCDGGLAAQRERELHAHRLVPHQPVRGRRGGRPRPRARGCGAAPGPARRGPRGSRSAAGSGSVGSSSMSSTCRTQRAICQRAELRRWPGRRRGTGGPRRSSSSGSNCGWVSCSLLVEHRRPCRRTRARSPGFTTWLDLVRR